MTYRSFCGIWSASFMLLVAEVIASDLPIREITVFKDGHAIVVHEGEAETQPDGSVELNYVPQPVIGTFWLHSADDQAELISVAAR